MDITVEVLPREQFGTRAAKRYRRGGFIPAEVYGKNERNFHALVKKSDIIKLLHKTHGERVVINLKLNGDVKQAVIKDIQTHPVKDEILHIDFQVIHKGEEIEVEVPVVVVGEVPTGGILEVMTKTLAVKATPANIPAHVEIDISDLKVGDVVYVKDIPTRNFTIAEDPDMVVVVIGAPKGEEEKEGVISVLNIRSQGTMWVSWSLIILHQNATLNMRNFRQFI